jgi:feruloyl esterase
MRHVLRGLHRTAKLLSTALLTSLVGVGATPAAATTCASLAGLTPTSDSNIKLEVWMPYSGWNGRFVGTGNGGIAGLMTYFGLGFLPSNYAVANTDMGTSPAATDPLAGRVLTGHPEKQIDYGTRSTHLMTVRSKQIIEAFYRERPEYSYFFGCSTGGGQGIHEALQFPGDYDGIIALAPAMNMTHNTAAKVWNYQAFNGPANITTAQATAITAAIVRQCAGKDGGLSSDNFLTDPRNCHWDPASLQCTGGAADAATCLTAPQIAAMRKFYEGPINPRTGKRIYAGRTRGSESNNGYPAAFASLAKTAGAPTYWVFGNDFDWLTFDFDHNMDTLDDAMAAKLNANTPDLEEFKSHGGKLLLWHGFADPEVPTLNTIAYYERLVTSETRGGRHDDGKRKEGLQRTQKFARLFLAPGVAHCSGGPGPDNFGDVISRLVQWVEQGVAPDQIVASKIVNGVTTFTRPLCPYPALPRYSGVGDPTKASSFACVDDSDRDDNQPPALKYLNDGDNYPIVPIDDHDRDHDNH